MDLTQSSIRFSFPNSIDTLMHEIIQKYQIPDHALIDLCALATISMSRGKSADPQIIEHNLQQLSRVRTLVESALERSGIDESILPSES